MILKFHKLVAVQKFEQNDNKLKRVSYTQKQKDRNLRIKISNVVVGIRNPQFQVYIGIQSSISLQQLSMNCKQQQNTGSAEYASGVIVFDYFACFRQEIQRITGLKAKLSEAHEQNLMAKKEVQTLENRLRRLRQKKRQRRPTRELDKDFACPYKDCELAYASELALNLHIKNKHSGGTKTEREMLARNIVQAKQRGLQIPQISLNLPPNILEHLKIESSFHQQAV